MPWRTRTRSVGRIRGGRILALSQGTTYLGPDIIQFYAKCQDNSTGWGKQNEFSLQKEIVNVTPMSGVYTDTSGSINTIYEDYVPTYASASIGVGSPPTSASFLVPQVLSKSNPSRPYVDVGTFTGELRDLPRMFKGIWDTAKPIYRELSRNRSVRERLDRAFKEAAKQTLGKPDSRFIELQFGWLPFVSDVEKYLNSGRVIESRYKELLSLRESGTSSRRVSLDSDTERTPPTLSIISSQRGLIKGRISTAYSYKRWGVGKWYLDPNGRLAKTDDLAKIERLAKESVQGLVLDQSTAWNLMPWSWLIDWAGNAGDWIESSRNIVGATKSPDVVICSYKNGLRSCERKPGDDDWPEMTGGDFVVLTEHKDRYVLPSTNLPELTVPILSDRQSAILSSLMTMRARRS